MSDQSPPSSMATQLLPKKGEEEGKKDIKS
jgi:hypothetical protein